MSGEGSEARWPWGVAAFAMAVVALAAGVCVVSLASRGCMWPAVVALALSALWLGGAIALLIVRFGARRRRVELDEEVVREAIKALREVRKDDGRSAEALDRLDRLALRSFESRRRP